MVDVSAQRYMTSNSSTIMVRVPGFKQYNFHKSKLEEAIETRDRLCHSIGRDPYENFSFSARRTHTKSHSDKKSSLPVGISLCTQRKMLADGSETEYKIIVAIGCRGSIPKTRAFSIIKYGKQEALEKAIDWRNKTFATKSQS